ncbi:MAG: glycosyltransferase family 39 protein [Candidatus Roizmanbacteria bacterium]|nr:glycosyltransferase family 39 protein [Candidatus Roizmanbacteria bacterium]
MSKKIKTSPKTHSKLNTKKGPRINGILHYGFNHKMEIILLLLLVTHIFFRFYLLAERAHLGWDEVDAAWAAKRIIVDKEVLFQGPVAKGNSGIYMGPLYYYLVAPFYYFTNLHPIASPIFAGVMSIVSFLVIYFVTKKIFGVPVGLVAVFINTFSLYVINSDRTQSAFTLIPIISYVIFYFLYRIVVKREPKYIVHLAVSTGLAFHIDFTAVFFPITILLSLPFFPRIKKTLSSIGRGIPLFLIFLLPTLLADQKSGNSISTSFTGYLQTYYHGLHIRRVLQLAHDAHISLEQVLYFKIFRPLVFLFVPLFAGLYYRVKPERSSLVFFYIIALWIVVPWIVLSTYSGELTHYYFALSRNIFIAILAFLTVFIYQKTSVVFRTMLVLFWIGYAVSNIQGFLRSPGDNLIGTENFVRSEINAGRTVPFEDKSQSSYMYYVLTGKIGEPVKK